MPGNWGYLKEQTYSFFTSNYSKDKSVLDLGCGHGFYKKLLGEYFTGPWHAVEIWKPYIDKYKLEELYDQVFNENLLDFEFEYYDIIIMGDVLEHLSRSDGANIIKKLKDKCEELFVVVPYNLPQETVNDNVFETHLQEDLNDDIMLEHYPDLTIATHNNLELKISINRGDVLMHYCAFKKKQ
jgi:SAM-dependent methyltransferase